MAGFNLIRKGIKDFMAENIYNKYAGFSTGNGVGFKAGTQANLNALIDSGEAQEGVFYLTTDTQRLYIGRKEVKGESVKVIPVPVNQGVTVVKTLPSTEDDEANVGDIYYLTDSNILCVKNGDGQWVQINPDKYLNSLTTAIAQANDGTTTITTTAAVKNTTDTASTSYSIKGKDIQVAVDNTNVTLTGIKPNLKVKKVKDTDGAQLLLCDINKKDNDNKYVELNYIDFKAGDNVTITPSEGTKDAEGNNINNSITISAKDYSVSSGATSLNNDSSINVSLSKKGTTDKVSFSTKPLKINYGKTAQTASLAEETEADKKNWVWSLDVYTQAEIDQKITELNSMTYKGAAKQNIVIPTTDSKIQIGDTYQIDENSLSYNPIEIYDDASQGFINETQTDAKIDTRIGDLLIARALTENELIEYATSKGLSNLVSGEELTEAGKKLLKEDANGYLLAVYWVYIPAGNDIDTTYKLIKNPKIDNSIQLKCSTDTENNTTSTDFSINGNDVIEVALKNTAFTIGHNNTVNTATDIENADAVTEVTIPTVNYDTHGHVTQIENTKYKIQQRYLSQENSFLKADNTTNRTEEKATISIATKAGTSKDTSTDQVIEQTITSKTLKFTQNKTEENKDNPHSINIDLVWGSF